ncbi:MAG: ComEC/Rec2 family competence protein [Propionibacteriaceae bacterium]|nr:ComEC/Rec2 family competence protein [Propionibacteriaceae bacterium]
MPQTLLRTPRALATSRLRLLGSWNLPRRSPKFGDRQSGLREREVGGFGHFDWRPVVLAASLWAGMWACTSAIPVLMLITGCAGALVALIAAREERFFAISLGLALLACLPMAGLRMWAIQASPISELAGEAAVVTISARIGSGKSGMANSPWWGAAAIVDEVADGPRSWKTSSRVWVIVGGQPLAAWQDLAPGTLVRATVSLAPSQSGDSSYAAIARAREPPEVLAPPSVIDATVERLHQGLRESVAHLAPEPRSLVPALVVGDVSLMGDELREEFAATGLTHLTAVSGANLTIILACLMFAAARMGVRGWWLRVIAVAGVVFFVVLCRSEPSVLRAAAMGFVGLVSLGWASPRQGMRYLSTAVIALLVIDPLMSRSLGFSLSVAATAGIIVWANSWAAQLSKWVPGWLAEALCVPLAAQLATQPIVTWISAQISVVCVGANLVAGPLVAPATVMGCLAVALAQLWLPLAMIPGTIAGWFAQGLCQVATFGAALPGAAYAWPANQVGMFAIAGICAALLMILSHPKGIRALVPGLCFLLVLSLFSPPAVPGWPPANWRIVSCDVGQGDATILNAGGGNAVVVDTGPEPEKLDACLRGLGIRTISLLVLTHLHADHIGGLTALRSGRELAKVMHSAVEQPAGGWRQVVQAISGVPHEVAVPGAKVQVGNVVIEVLAAKPFPEFAVEAQGDSPDENNSSLVLRAWVGELSAVLCGDLEEQGQLDAVASAADMSADVFLVPHHGSARQSAELWRSVGAAVALISVGADNPYGHPAKATARLAQSQGMRVFRTDLQGSIAISVGEKNLKVTTEKRQ